MHEERQPVALKFLQWFCPVGLYEGIEGDLFEEYKSNIEQRGERIAKRRLFWSALRFLKLEILLRNRISLKLINTIMIGNYMKVASRNILKRKMYSFINATGLSVGIAFCILIYLFIRDEKSFDQFHSNKARIYRLEEKSFDTWQPNPKNPFNRSDGCKRRPAEPSWMSCPKWKPPRDLLPK